MPKFINIYKPETGTPEDYCSFASDDKMRILKNINLKTQLQTATKEYLHTLVKTSDGYIPINLNEEARKLLLTK